MMLWRQGRHVDALRHARHALALFQAAGHRPGQAHVLNQIGWLHGELGDFETLLHHREQALALHQQLDDRIGAANAWDSLGYAHHHLTREDEALRCYQRAIDLFRDQGGRYDEAVTLVRRGDQYHATGQPNPARQDWTAALAIFDRLRHPEHARVLAKLAAPYRTRHRGLRAPGA